MSYSNANHGNEAKDGGACDDSPWQTVSDGGWSVYRKPSIAGPMTRPGRTTEPVLELPVVPGVRQTRTRTSDRGAPIDSPLQSAYCRFMEHNTTEHWHQSEAVRDAAREIDRIDLYDTVMFDYEYSVAIQTDTSKRIRDLLALTNFYHRDFGVHFEKRHAYREQLHRVLTGELETVGAAKFEARSQYAVSGGLGLPRMERLAKQNSEELPENGIVV